MGCISREFRQFFLNHDLFIPLLFLARVIFVTALELIAPARKISYRSVILYDLFGCTLVGYLLIPASQFLSYRIALHASVPQFFWRYPWPLRSSSIMWSVTLAHTGCIV